MLSVLGKQFSRWHFAIFFFFYISQKISSDIPALTFHPNCLLKYQNLFSGKKNKKYIINLSSAKFAQRVVKFKGKIEAKTTFQANKDCYGTNSCADLRHLPIRTIWPEAVLFTNMNTENSTSKERPKTNVGELKEKAHQIISIVKKKKIKSMMNWSVW